MSIEAMKLALDALDLAHDTSYSESNIRVFRKAIELLGQALEQAEKQEPVSIKSVAKKAGINLPENYIPTMGDAITAGDSVLMNEQAALLRECRLALDSLIAQKPTLAGLLCGSTTLGNLKAELGAYRPQGVFGANTPQRQTIEQANKCCQDTAACLDAGMCIAHAEQAQKQEPVAWADLDENGELKWESESCFSDDPAWLENPVPLYTFPPQRQPLTDEEIELLEWAINTLSSFSAPDRPVGAWAFVYMPKLGELRNLVQKHKAAHGIKGEA